MSGSGNTGSAPRQVTSLGDLRWSSGAATALEPQLSRMLLDNITARIGVVDRDGRYVYANREMCDFFGLPPERVIGRLLVDIIGPESWARYAPFSARVLAGEALRLEGWVDYPGQGPRYLRETFVPYGPEGGPVECIAVFGRDSTELKLREQELTGKLAELHMSEALKSAIVDHAFAALVSTDAAGAIVEFNPAAEAMFGCRRAEALGRAVGQVMIPERYRAAHEAGMRRMQAGGAKAEGRVLGQRMELFALRADGSEFPIEMVLWRTDVQDRAFYTASINDISERRSAQAQIERQRDALRQGEKLTAMGSLLAGVAHELNNPLAIVMGRASLLEEKSSAYPELQADARRIHEAAERCGRIVRTFMNMARKRPSQRGPVAFNELVRAAVEMLQYGLRSHGIQLELSLAHSLPPIMGDGDPCSSSAANSTSQSV